MVVESRKLGGVAADFIKVTSRPSAASISKAKSDLALQYRICSYSIRSAFDPPRLAALLDCGNAAEQVGCRCAIKELWRNSAELSSAATNAFSHA